MPTIIYPTPKLPKRMEPTLYGDQYAAWDRVHRLRRTGRYHATVIRFRYGFGVVKKLRRKRR